MNSIQLAQSDDEIERCFAVMKQLRTHLEAYAFLPTIRRQQAGGYRLVMLESDSEVVAVAGFRILDNLAGGRIMYVDDLVTDAAGRSRGFGGELFDWLIAEAKTSACLNLELDSGVQRFDAHRFYLTHRMAISSHHFRLKLSAE